MDVIRGILLGLTALSGSDEDRTAERTSPGAPQTSARKPVVN